MRNPTPDQVEYAEQTLRSFRAELARTHPVTARTMEGIVGKNGLPALYSTLPDGTKIEVGTGVEKTGDSILSMTAEVTDTSGAVIDLADSYRLDHLAEFVAGVLTQRGSSS